MAIRITLCGFCRRHTCERTEAGSANKEQEAVLVDDGLHLPDNILIGETYCRDCEQFYHQLITFGRGDARASNWNIPEPPSSEIPHPGMMAGPPT